MPLILSGDMKKASFFSKKVAQKFGQFRESA